MKTLAAALALALLCPLSQPAPAEASPVPQCCELWIVNSDGTEERQLQDHGASLDHPEWSPVEDVILTSGSDVVVVDPDGGEATNLTNTEDVHEREATWSPDGSRIAFVSTEFGNEDIFVMDSDGSNIERLETGSEHDYEPLWSPDGEQIAFIQRPYEGGQYLRVINLVTGAITVLGEGTRPAWSDDSERLAFLDSAGAIRVVDSDGGSGRVLRSEGYGSTLSWAPHEEILCGCGDIIEIDPETGQQTSLGSGQSPQREREGDRIAYASEAIYVVEPGSEPRKVSNPTVPPGYQDVTDYSPQWSHDGSQIMFRRGRMSECGSWCEPRPPYEGPPHVRLGVSLRYSATEESFFGHLKARRDSPQEKACLADREVRLKQYRSGDVWQDDTDRQGRWRIEGPKRPAGLFFIQFQRARRVVAGEKVICQPGRGSYLPVFVDAPVLHPYCRGKPATHAGTRGPDRVESSVHQDVVATFGGDDRISSRGGRDVVCAGRGHDDVDAGESPDTVFGGLGDDTIFGGSEPGELYADFLVPGLGDDTVDGGDGRDTVSFPLASSGINIDLTLGRATGEGADSLLNLEVIMGTRNNDVISGTDADESIWGAGGNDALSGAAGNDDLWGQAGDDDLNGGPGDDRADGGAGNDHCVEAESIYTCD